MSNEAEQIAQRRAKLDELARLGVAIYPNAFDRTATVTTIKADHDARTGEELEAAGHKAEGLPVSRQQVEFYKANKTELDAMFAKQKAKAHPEDAEDDRE